MTSSHARKAAIAAALAAVCACDKPPANSLQSCEASQVFAGHVRTDILFVVDDSGSMSNNENRLRLGLSRFVNRLANSPIVDDFQIGVTNTSVIDTYVSPPVDYYTTGPNSKAPVVPFPKGALVSVDTSSPFLITDTTTWGKYFWTSSINPPGPGFYGPRNLTYQYMVRGDANLVTDFQNDVLVGSFGSPREEPFEAMRLALSTQLLPGGENVGFVRKGARLAIIFLSDEDDCSAPATTIIRDDQTCRAQRTANPSVLTPVSDYASFLQGPIDGEKKDVVLAAVVAVTCSNGVCQNVMCPTGGTLGDPPATRYLDLLGAFPYTSTTLASICDNSFDSALDAFADRVMSQTLPLQGNVADYHLLVVTVTKTTGQVVSCPVAAAGSAGVSTAGALYTPSQGSYPATLTFLGPCTLSPGDKIDVKVICAG